MIIPLILIALGIGTVVGLAWYESLSDEQKQIADAHAARLALQIYNRSLDELSRDQLEHVLRQVKRLTGF